MPNEQLAWITELLGRFNVGYWLDSGTLLGMCRDGALIESDGDIDLGIWEEDESKLRGILPQIRAAGYQTVIITFQNRTFKVVCYPRVKTHSRKIDFVLYRRSAGFAWAPQRMTPPNPHRPRTLRCFIYGAGARLIRWYLKSWFNHRKIDSWLVSTISEVRTWWVPLEFFEELSVLEIASICVSVPKQWESYLRYRYGDWQTPNRSWSYWDDDRGLAHQHPEKLVLTEGAVATSNGFIRDGAEEKRGGKVSVLR